MPSPKLKPCPFCGGAVKLAWRQKYDFMRPDTQALIPIRKGFFVRCFPCHFELAEMGNGYPTEAQAVAAWNRRAVEDAK